MDFRQLKMVVAVVLWIGCGGTPPKIEEKPIQAAKKPQVVLPGRGVGSARVGMTLEQMVESLGEPQSASLDESKHMAQRFFPDAGVRASFIKGKAFVISLMDGHAKTAQNLRIGSSRTDVEAIYGLAAASTDRAPTRKLYHLGITFEFENDVVSSIHVYKPQLNTAPAVDFYTPDVGITLAELIEIVGLPMSADDSKVIYRCLDVEYKEEGGVVTGYLPTTESVEWCK